MKIQNGVSVWLDIADSPTSDGAPRTGNIDDNKRLGEQVFFLNHLLHNTNKSIAAATR